MSVTSKRVKRFEKEAILRAKECEYKREASEDFLSNLHLHSEDDDESDRRRRQVTTRQIRKIQQDADYQLEMMEKLNEPKYQVKKRQNPATTTSTQNHYASSLSSSIGDRANRDNSITEKYTSNKHTSGGKAHPSA